MECLRAGTSTLCNGSTLVSLDAAVDILHVFDADAGSSTLRQFFIMVKHPVDGSTLR